MAGAPEGFATPKVNIMQKFLFRAGGDYVVVRQSPKPRRWLNFWYNIDRAIASAVWGTSQETISSEVGRIARGERQIGEPLHCKFMIRFCKFLAHWLDTDTTLWGPNHTGKAIQHADLLDSVDDGQEK